ncbi:UBX domain-containing protein 8 [Phascolarctos cinereus]|uniref:UBX domain-containing protein 8 n=1 Tax=Phascolarctos cinereus TaxID=38626 RepID=A0A6P5LZM1_PHACI|nr:UBX domain-containing protein 8 [Phascolarctos cinereus]
MVARAAWLLLAAPALPLLCLQLRSAGFNPGWKDIALLGGRGLLFLAILTLIILMTTPWLTSQAPSKVCLTVTEDENKRRQKRVREEQQETLSIQSSAYLKNVLKPRQEVKLRKQEERFYQMTGESWKLLAGYKLGALGLPEEPPETAEEVVTVALRCPDGRVLKRRFYKTCSSQVLLDWMMKVGYHRSIYTLSTSYPRRPLEVGEDQTLEDTGLTTDTVLNVEEKEPYLSL